MENITLVYFNSENYLTFEEVVNITLSRYIELLKQGFNNEQITRIIFEDSSFKSNFLAPEIFESVRKIVMAHLDGTGRFRELVITKSQSIFEI